MVSRGPGAEAEVGRVEARCPQSLHLPGASCAIRVVAQGAGISTFEALIQIPDPFTYLLCDPLEMTLPLCVSSSSSVKRAERECLPPSHRGSSE